MWQLQQGPSNSHISLIDDCRDEGKGAERHRHGGVEGDGEAQEHIGLRTIVGDLEEDSTREETKDEDLEGEGGYKEGGRRDGGRVGWREEQTEGRMEGRTGGGMEGTGEGGRKGRREGKRVMKEIQKHVRHGGGRDNVGMLENEGGFNTTKRVRDG